MSFASKSTIIIAESASNHNGELDKLYSLAEASKEAKADYLQ